MVKQNWQAVKAQMELQGESYVACPLVLIELLDRLSNPAPQYFSNDLKAFLFLSDSQNNFLPFPGYFVLKTVLNTESPVTGVHPAEFNQLLQTVISASSREALSDGDVELPGSSVFTYGIDFGVLTKQHRNGKAKHVAQMTSLQRAKLVPSRQEFAEGFLRSQRILPKKGEVEAIAEALDAAYEYERFLLADLDDKYDYGKHESDWVDRQLLYYLADPNMFIVTNDKKIKLRCKRSKQSDRILEI